MKVLRRAHHLPRIKHFPGIALTILLLALLTYLLGWSTLLSARTVVIDGTDRKSEINSRIFGSTASFHLGEPLARVDVHAISRRISQLDWVDQESVKREWLHGRIHVVIKERTPIAQFTDSSGKRIVIDKSGALFTSTSSSTYPLITFLHSDKASVAAIAEFLQLLPPDLLASLDSLAIQSPEFIQSAHVGQIGQIALGSGKLIVRWGNNSELTTKVKVMRALLALPENSKAKLLDLSSPLSPIIK